MASRVLDVHNVKGTRVALTMPNNANTTHVVAAGDHAQVARVELHMVGHLSGGDVDDNSVVDLQ